ncbi:hypothetical protein N665_4133s0002 [Sinapis alba]|nr:hypothetical protein N665_4133s0002 [Sinapis alba]
MENRPQVFISYRGKDLRLTLVPHIKHHLKDSNVNVFTDSNATGERLKNLFNHIKDSRIVIVIFSISYLESRWCLDELAEIRNCLLRKQLDFVIPIFYKVKTSHVEKQTGDFGKPFPSLQKKHPHLRVLRWKKALKFVAKSIGLSYRENCSIPELDFIKNIVEVVNGLLGRIALKDSNNNTTPQIYKGEASNSNQTVLDVNQLNELLHLSKTKAPEAVNVDRFFRTGFMFGFAWKDLIWTMKGGNGFEVSPDANSLQFHMNIQSLNTQGNESLEKAINLLALHMMCEQTNPAVIFSNWDKLDHYTKTIIIYSARKKCYMLMAYTEVSLCLCLFEFLFPFLEISSVLLLMVDMVIFLVLMLQRQRLKIVLIVS